MSNSNDSFIDEVSEEIRRDRLYTMLRRYGWIVALVVVGIVATAGYLEWDKSRKRAAAQALGDGVLDAVQAPDAGARLRDLAQAAGSGGERALLAQLLAAEVVSGSDAESVATAVALLEAVAADATLAPAWRDLAALRLLMLPGHNQDGVARQADLEALAQPGRPYRLLAEEQLALVALETGERQAALARFGAIRDDPEAPQGLRDRAAQMMIVLGTGLGGG